MDEARANTWEGFYRWNEGRAPRPVFLTALARFDGDPVAPSDRRAVDLGCGDGVETLALLEAGWRVVAIDSEPASIGRVQALVPKEAASRLELRQAPFEGLRLPRADFVYAGYSLPFCNPSRFDELWAEITACLAPGGRLAGQLFGIRDSWAVNREMTFVSREDVRRLLGLSFEVEDLQEREEDGDSLGGPKHWHVFDIIARRAIPRAQDSPDRAPEDVPAR